MEISDNYLIFTQRRYPSSNGEIYAIPLTLSTKSNNDFNTKTPLGWMTTEKWTMAMSFANFNEGDWIILNNQQIGYYKADYSTELWQAIIAQLKSDYTKIHPINRAVLRDEIYLGWKNLGRVTAAHVLESLLYFSLEDEAISWSKSNQFLSELKMRLSGSEIYDKFTKFLRDLTNPQLITFGYEGSDFEHTDITDLRNQLRNWNCHALDGACLLNEYQKWFNYNSTNTPSSFDFCFAMTLLDTAPFNQILTAITTDVNYPPRGNYLDSLGCNRNEENLKLLLDASIDRSNNLSEGERMKIIRNVFSKSHLGLKTTINFIDDKHAEISAINATQFVPLFTQLVQYINPDSLIDFIRLRDKLDAAGYLATDEFSLINVIYSRTQTWYATNFELIKSFFDSYSEPITTTTITSTTTTTQNPGTSTSTQNPGTSSQSPTTVRLYLIN